jgi:single-stranded-DNA-specific exonuclease
VADARYRWIFPAPVTLDPSLAEAGQRMGLSSRVTALLAARGVADAADLEAFFAAPEAGLHDPGLLPDADRFAARIARARRDGESVMVFGDFDADGLTGLAILVRTLRRLGIAVRPWVPSRLEEGHGLSMAAVRAAGEDGIAVIVTVDCGTTSLAEIEAAAAAGIDVLVTDHHRVPPVLPPAEAIVNPHRPDSQYPDRRLAGSGVAFKLAQLLLAGEPDGPAAALDLADLAMIGTVSDIAPVVGENRSIARIGLARVHAAPRPGIAALLATAGVAAAAADLETVSFQLAPRLNAAGRVGEAMEAARLLLADDPEEAARLAEALEGANKTRRDLMRQAVGEAREAVAAMDTGIVPSVTLVRGDWPVGILGLVASRLADDLGRPAVVGAPVGTSIRASCRSDGVMDLGAALEACGDLFDRFGGHAGAAGFELPASRWDAFAERFTLLASAAAPRDPRQALRLDLAVPAAEVDYAFHRDLGRLAPCGPGNPDPVVAILGLTVTRVRPAAGGHSQVTLRRIRDIIDGIAFDREDLATTVDVGDRVDVVGRLTSRTFGGFESLQVEIRDLAPSGSHPDAAAILGQAASPPIMADAPLVAGSSA